MIIDVHAHAASEDFIRATNARPDYGLPYELRPDGSYFTRGYGEMERMMWDVDARLESLARQRSGQRRERMARRNHRPHDDSSHEFGHEVSRAGR